MPQAQSEHAGAYDNLQEADGGEGEGVLAGDASNGVGVSSIVVDGSASGAGTATTAAPQPALVRRIL